MTRTAAILGSGKIARDVGLFLLRRGWSVTWVSASVDRRRVLADFVARAVRRLQRESPDSPVPNADVREPDPRSPLPVRVAIECTTESPEAKRRAIAGLGWTNVTGRLLFSASSSILPGQIHPGCVGLHPFYPLELTNLVELVIPREIAPDDAIRAADWVAECGLHAIAQDERTAFALNRLLLPLQNECLRALAAGVPPGDVDRDSVTPLFAAGQLMLMDSVGLDVILASARQYVARMGGDERASMAPLLDGLGLLVSGGKCGRKNDDGFLMGKPLPWPANPHPPPGWDDGASHCRFLFLHTCERFLREGMISAADLARAQGCLSGPGCPIPDLICRNERALREWALRRSAATRPSCVAPPDTEYRHAH